MLAALFQQLPVLDLDFTLEATGFEIGEIDMHIHGLTGAPDVGEDGRRAKACLR